MSTHLTATISITGRLQALARRSGDLDAASTEIELFDTVSTLGDEVLLADRVEITLWAGPTSEVRVVRLGRADDGPERHHAALVPSAGRAATDVALARLYRHEPDPAAAGETDLRELAVEGLTAVAVVPLCSAERAVGALTVARRGVAFDEDDRLVLWQAGALVASAFERIRSAAAVEEAETDHHKARMIMARRSNELEILARIMVGIEQHDLATALVMVTTEVAGLRGVELCRVAAVDSDGSLVVVASGARHGARFQDGDSVLRHGSPDHRAVTTMAPVVWRRPGADEHAIAVALRDMGATSLFSVPILRGDEAIGAITAGSTGGHRLIGDEHIVLAELVARQLAVAATSVARGLLAAGI
ncbi:MAG: GAF domain-containing protein [Acidimicrobiales bacterium]